MVVVFDVVALQGSSDSTATVLNTQSYKASSVTVVVLFLVGDRCYRTVAITGTEVSLVVNRCSVADLRSIR